jgi:hypothetical protein
MTSVTRITIPITTKIKQNIGAKDHNPPELEQQTCLAQYGA